jgi:hypothetical protein
MAKNEKNYLLAELRPKLKFWSQNSHRQGLKFFKKTEKIFFQHLN